MRNFLLFFLVLFMSTTIQAQEVLITKEGDALKVYGLEVSSEAVFFRKSPEKDSPIQRLAKSELLMIKYADGRKQIIDNPADQSHLNTNTPSEVEGHKNAVGTMTPEVLELNNKRIESFNITTLSYTGTDTQKSWGSMAVVLGLKEGSTIETPEVSLSFGMKLYAAEHSMNKGVLKRAKIVELKDMDDLDPIMDTRVYKMVITVKNKTSKTIYIDLGNSFVTAKGEATSYYIPTAKTSTSGTSNGVGVNAGAVAGAIGIGGALGTLANGVTVGGGSMNQSSTTTFSQRVIAIPPMSAKSLEPQGIGEEKVFNGLNNGWDYNNSIVKSIIPTFLEKGYAQMVKGYPKMMNFCRGQIINLEPDANSSPLSALVTYSADEQFSSTKSLQIEFYVRQIMGYNNLKYVNFKQCPLLFFYSSTSHYRNKFKVLD